MTDLVQRIADYAKTHPTVRFEERRVHPSPAATDEQVRSTERRLGFQLPSLLTRLYREFANGGFGPGYGVIGVEGGYTADLRRDLADGRDELAGMSAADPGWIWPRTYVPFCFWGCTMYSVVDCGSRDSPVLMADVGDDKPIFDPRAATIEEWFESWLEGRDLWDV